MQGLWPAPRMGHHERSTQSAAGKALPRSARSRGRLQALLRLERESPPSHPLAAGCGKRVLKDTSYTGKCNSGGWKKLNTIEKTPKKPKTKLTASTLLKTGSFSKTAAAPKPSPSASACSALLRHHHRRTRGEEPESPSIGSLIICNFRQALGSLEMQAACK